jgi:TfoX/Sxy family transcriptional regulator of competence genes
VADAQSLFDGLVDDYAGRPGVTYGRMMSSNGLKVHGKIFAMLNHGALVVKVPADRVAELLAQDGATAFEPRPGRRMREWVVIPLPTAPEDVQWPAITAEAFAYVSSLAG